MNFGVSAKGMNKQNEQFSREFPIRVLVADGSRIHTQLLADAMKRDSGLEVSTFNSDSAGVVASAVSREIDVLVISSDLDDDPSRGFEVLRELRAVHPRTRAVVLLNMSKKETVLSAFRAGARGVFSNNEPVELLCKCVRCVHQGEIWAKSSELSAVVEALASAPTVRAVNADGMSLLSKRELQVVRYLAEGLTNKEIAERLELSQHTVKNYLFRVFDKVGVSNRVELLFMTLRQTAAGRSTKPGWPQFGEGGSFSDEFALLQRAAEAGLPLAQLALAQMYLARRTDSQDIVHAYSWYLVAMERASESKGLITKMMTAQQIEKARQEASARLAKGEKSVLSLLKRPPSRRLPTSTAPRLQNIATIQPSP
jgi:two-component system, NarL family, nitrate/nitrite response regulator NarL